MQSNFGKFPETIFGVKICKFKQISQAGNQQNHCKNNGVSCFFRFSMFCIRSSSFYRRFINFEIQNETTFEENWFKNQYQVEVGTRRSNLVYFCKILKKCSQEGGILRMVPDGPRMDHRRSCYRRGRDLPFPSTFSLKLVPTSKT